ncbi:MAG: DUF4358 domain-containing protein [Clostridia bacterium]|nr:DUF4358 domain-containing protein [Clostridia bacterium]
MKNIFRTIIAVMLAAVCALALVACSGNEQKNNGEENNAEQKNTGKEYDVEQLAKSIFENVKFEDEYVALVDDKDFALSSYGIDPALVADKDGVKEDAVYVSASTPEMIVCVKAVDEASAKTVMSAVENKISDYINNYTTYGPEQVAKLESAVKVTNGQYVVVVVSNDNSAAASFVNGLFN